MTFILRGELSHKDSGGHESIIGTGGMQWMTAGSGLIHSELSPESFKNTAASWKSCNFGSTCQPVLK